MADDSLLRKVRAARAEYQRADSLTRASVQTIERLRERMRNADAQGMDEVVSALGREFTEETAELQERLTEVSRATRELEAALAEASLESSQLRSDALKQQATFAGGALIGTATVTEILLPKEQIYLPILWAAYGILLVTICASLLLLHWRRGTRSRSCPAGSTDSGGRSSRCRIGPP